MITLDVDSTLFSTKGQDCMVLEVCYFFEYVIYTLTCLLIPFMPFLNGLLEFLAWQGLGEMVEGEVILDREHIGRLTKASLGTEWT